jgi:sulfiredoxin
MMKTMRFSIASIYVPAKRRATLDARKVQTLAESIMESGQKAPILVRQDGERFVLLEGSHRLEACRSLGEETILGYLVEARQH